MRDIDCVACEEGTLHMTKHEGSKRWLECTNCDIKPVLTEEDD